MNTALAGGKGLDSYIPGGSANTPLDDFLSGQDITSSNSVLQLRAKSAALFEAAARTADMRDPCKQVTCGYSRLYGYSNVSSC